MTSDNYFTSKRLLLLVTFFVFSFSKINAQDGKAIFTAKCASCHIMGKDFTGPNLHGVLDRWGGNKDDIKAWILNYNIPLKAGNAQANNVINFATSQMQIFEGQITPVELDAVVEYITKWEPPLPPKPGGR